MVRLLFSVLVAVALASASAGSVMHGLDHGVDHLDHHTEMGVTHPSSDAEQALADCCDTAGGMGSPSCFGDLVAMSAMLPFAAATRKVAGTAHADPGLTGLTPTVPKAPPKI